MKVCSHCGVEKTRHKFRKKKNKLCKKGYYVSGVCVECENERGRGYYKKNKEESPDFVIRRRQAVKKYQQTQKGKLNKAKQYRKYKKKHREYYLANSKSYYQRRLSRLKKEIEGVTDEYIITQLQNPHRKKRYTRAFLKEHPEVIELARIRILNSRLKKKIEETSEFGVCRQCGLKVKKEEFRKQQATDKRTKHVIRLCKKCRSNNNKINWAKFKEHNERHSKPKKPFV